MICYGVRCDTPTKIKTYSCKGWSDEAYPVHCPVPNGLASFQNPVAFSIERAALPLFGFPNFGSLLTGSVFFIISFSFYLTPS